MPNSSLICRGAVALPATATGEMMFMPGGLQEITPFGGGIGQPIQVLVDAHGAAQIEKQRSALAAKGKRPYFDFEHTDHGASYWPDSFFWKDGPEPGIYCRGEWTNDGKTGVDGKTWRAFSPVFHVDSKTAKPAQITCRDTAHPNMGGLVNDPAFKSISPLWAKNASGAQSANQTNNTMTPEEIKALQDKITALEAEIAKLKAEDAAETAKGTTNDVVAAKLEAKQAQLKASSLELQMTSLQAKNANHESALKARNEADAKAAVASAVERGAIAAKDTATIAAWEKDIAENPDRAALLAKMNGHAALGAGRITPHSGAAAITQESSNHVMKSYGALVAKNASIRMSPETAAEKNALAREAAAIFAADINDNKTIVGMSIDEAIKAADYSDPNSQVGLLTGSLALQRALPLMQFEYPVLSQVTTDFTTEPGLLNQTVNSRIILKPAVQSYDTSVDTAGRPKGWSTVSAAKTVDVPITLDEYVGIPIVFGNNILASTMRNLFSEQAPQALYALGGYMVSKLTALFTTANYNAYAGTSLTGGATTSGSKSISFTSPTNPSLYPGLAITGTGIPADTFIVSVDTATTATLSKKATATGSGLTFTLGSSQVPTTYASYVKAMASFGVAALDDIAVAFDQNEVPMQERFALLNSGYYRKLGGDAAVIGAFTAWQKPEILTDRQLPKLAGFDLVNAPWFPSTSNRTGFAGTKAAALIKTRLPQDFIGAIGAQAPGSVTVVTDPATGLSVSLVQYVNLQSNYAEWRPEVLLGAAVGDRRAGMVITSA